MNVEHKDINKFIPYGEMLRGYSSQNLISKADIDRILRERGIFALNQEKAYTVPILQTLLLSPKEFEELRHSFSEREDNEKTISREIPWIYDKSIFIKDILKRTDSENKNILKILRSHLDSNNYDYDTIFFYGNKELPRWAGYSLGYYLVKKYLEKTGKSIEDAFADKYANFRMVLK